jgi:hypothetical protein
MTTFYRVTDGTMHELDAETFDGMAESKRAILRAWVVDVQPEPPATQAVVAAGIIVGEDEARQTWALRDLTADELRISVSPRQIRQALNAAGLRAPVEAAVASADQDTKDWWAFATSFDSDHPVLIGMAAALGMSGGQVRQVFEIARGL